MTLSGCMMDTPASKPKARPIRVEQKNKKIKEVKAKYKVTEQEWTIARDGVNIYGHLFLPQGVAGPKKAVILSHGLAGNYRDLVDYAKNLAGQGYVAYAFDFPGGAKNGRSSGVDQLSMSIFTEEQNLKTVLDAVKNRKDVDANEVSLLGESQGGAVSAMLASKYPKEVKSLVLMYPAFSITDYSQAAFKSIKKVPDTLNLFGFTVGKAYFAKLFKYDLLKSATKYKGPVLLLHGSDDIIVPETYSEKANKKFKNSRLHIIKHAGHEFKGEHKREAVSLIDKFLDKQ